jgi:hypothetical protein
MGSVTTFSTSKHLIDKNHFKYLIKSGKSIEKIIRPENKIGITYPIANLSWVKNSQSSFLVLE